MRMYLTLIEFLPKKQIFIGYFDQVEHEPELLLNNVLGFLGTARFMDYSSERLTTNVNAAAKKYKNDIPEEIRLLLSTHFLPQLERLMTVLDNHHIQGWYTKHKSYIENYQDVD